MMNTISGTAFGPGLWTSCPWPSTTIGALLTSHAPPATKMPVISAQSARYPHMTRRHRGGSLPSGKSRMTSGRTRKPAVHSSAITTAAGPSGSLPPWK